MMDLCISLFLVQFSMTLLIEINDRKMWLLTGAAGGPQICSSAAGQVKLRWMYCSLLHQETLLLGDSGMSEALLCDGL